MAGGATPQKDYYKRRFSALRNERSSWEGLWKKVSAVIAPRRSRFLTSDRNEGADRSNNIVNNTGVLASRTLASGMMSGITSPARPWFKLIAPTPQMMEDHAVKKWLADVERIMRMVFARSNLYQALHALYIELGNFGVACLRVEEDFEDVCRGYVDTVGSYFLATDERGSISTMYREIELTVEQVVNKFGIENVSITTKRRYEEKNFDATLKVYHVIEPNTHAVKGSKLAKDMPYRSVWYEAANNDDRMLKDSGFHEQAFMAPRWEVTGNDVYGSSCPGMVAVGDTNQLQFMERKSNLAIERKVDPPMLAPSALRLANVSSLPGAVTFYDALGNGADGVRELFKVEFGINELEGKMGQIQERINSAFFADLFLMLSQTDRREITAREVAERHEEKLLMLGPMLERLQDELLDPLIDRVFGIAYRAGIFPPVPELLQNKDLRVEYISILAQAQQAVSVGAVERAAGFVGNLAAVHPEVLDIPDWDQTVRDYYEQIGVSANNLKDPKKIEQIRAARARQEQMAQMAAMAPAAAQGAQAAKVMSEADVRGDNGLTRMLRP